MTWFGLRKSAAVWKRVAKVAISAGPAIKVANSRIWPPETRGSSACTLITCAALIWRLASAIRSVPLG